MLINLDNLRDLEAGWDSYGAKPIEERAIRVAEAFLNGLTAVPTARGGVQIECHLPELDFELQLDERGQMVSVCAEVMRDAQR